MALSQRSKIMQVNLYKQNVEYTKDGEVKTATNYFVQCGDVLVPVEVKYFEDKKTGEDKNYRSRRTLMSAFAETLPERKKAEQPQPQAREAENDPTA